MKRQKKRVRFSSKRKPDPLFSISLVPFEAEVVDRRRRRIEEFSELVDERLLLLGDAVTEPEESARSVGDLLAKLGHRLLDPGVGVGLDEFTDDAVGALEEQFVEIF